MSKLREIREEKSRLLSLRATIYDSLWYALGFDRKKIKYIEEELDRLDTEEISAIKHFLKG